MKLENVFKLYKSYYPASTPHSVSITACGAVQMYDSRRTTRLSISGAPELQQIVSRDAAPDGIALPHNTELLRAYCRDNRRELFMLTEARCLYGIFYAENATASLRMMSAVSTIRRPAAYVDGLRLTWLFALADSVTHCRYSLSAITADRTGIALLTATTGSGALTLRITPDAIVSVRAATRGRYAGVGDEMPRRYARYFCRDNAEWFAAFAAGKEALL